MGFRFRKSKKILPGVRLNFSKKGMGVSFGGKHARYSISPTGRRTTSFKVAPGLTYTTSSGGRKRQNKRRSAAQTEYTYSSPRKELKLSNAVAIAVSFLSFFLLWVLGIELSWSTALLKTASILIIVLFVAFMLVNNIPPLKSLVLGIFRKDKEVSIENPENEFENDMRLIDEKDFEMINQAVEACVDKGQASISYLQRTLKLGHAQTAHIMDELERLGVVSPSDNAETHSVLITKEAWEQRKAMYR